MDASDVPMPLTPRVDYFRLPKTRLSYRDNMGREFKFDVPVLNNRDPMCVVRTLDKYDDLISGFWPDWEPRERRELFRQLLAGRASDAFSMALEGCDDSPAGWDRALRRWLESLIVKDLVFEQQDAYMRTVTKPPEMDNRDFYLALQTLERAMRRLPRTGGDASQRVYDVEQLRYWLYEKQPDHFRAMFDRTHLSPHRTDADTLIAYFDNCCRSERTEKDDWKVVTEWRHQELETPNKRRRSGEPNLCNIHNQEHRWGECFLNKFSRNYNEKEAWRLRGHQV